MYLIKKICKIWKTTAILTAVSSVIVTVHKLQRKRLVTHKVSSAFERLIKAVARCIFLLPKPAGIIAVNILDSIRLTVSALTELVMVILHCP